MAKKPKIKQKISNNSHEIITKLKNTYLIERIKAFIVDMFMIMMPIMYTTTYIVMDGKLDFQTNELARWATAVIYGIVVISFWKISGQTPGLKAYDLKLVESESLQNITWSKSFLRYVIFLFSAITVLLLFLPFFRKDKKTIQDLLTNTTVVLVQR